MKAPLPKPGLYAAFCLPWVWRCLTFVCLSGLVPTTLQAGIAYGTINNFDTVNDTGVECHGFEIELHGIHSQDITYTYNWNHYGTPKILDDNSNPLSPRVLIRYESGKNPDGTWAAYTAIPAGPIPPTQGHQFTDPSVNFGGEHFGVGYSGNPTNILYHWLIDDGAGTLKTGPMVNVATPTFTYIPAAPAAPAQVQAVIKPPPAAPVFEFGPASWVKEIRTTSHNNKEIKLRDLISEDPDEPEGKNWRNGEPDEVEVEWQLLQVDFNSGNGGPNGELVGAPEPLEKGDEIITRRYEFYKYVGPLDSESGEAMGDRVAADDIHGVGIKSINGVDVDLSTVAVVGDYVGSQMSAFDNELPVGLIEHLPDGERDVPYPTRTVVIAGVPFTATTTGALPDGLTFDPATGQLSGTPSVSGVFAFHVRATSKDSPTQTRTYFFAIADAGQELPPHSTVDLSSEPLEGGTTTGSGLYTNGTVAVVSAVPAAGFVFSKWTDNGKVVSTSFSYPFTNLVNRSLVANFVIAPPELSFARLGADVLELSWPSGQPDLILQETVSLTATEWTLVSSPIVVSNGRNRVQITPLTGNRYYRIVRR